MTKRAPRIGHQQRRILQALYIYATKRTSQYVRRIELIDHLEMGESTFSRAIQRLAHPNDGHNNLPPLVEKGCYGTAMIEKIEQERPLRKAERKFLNALKTDNRVAYYRITDVGIQRVDMLNKRKGVSKPSPTPRLTVRVSHSP